MIICQPSLYNKWNSETSIKLLLHLILVTGIAAWSNKAQYRVMMVDIFKKYKSSSWDVVISTGICTTAKEINDEFYNDRANHTKTLDIDTRKCISDAKEELLTEIRRRKTNGTIKAIFKCIVCCESRSDSFAICLDCVRYLGCHTCIGRLSKCPLCRKEFNCVNCSNDLPKKNHYFFQV